MSDAISCWFAAHHGVISRDEAVRLGMSPRQIEARLRAGEWQRLTAGVFRLAGTPTERMAELRAAVLIAGLPAALSHRSAAWLWGIADDPGPPTVTVPHNRHPRPNAISIVRSRIRVDRVVRRGIPCTTVVRTIMDCAVSGSDEEIDALLDRALARKLLSVREVIRASADPLYAKHPGRARLQARLARRGVSGAPTPSALESRMARLFVEYGLPRPKAEVQWGPQRRYRLDFAYPQLRLAIEVDGWSSHFTPEQQRWDNKRSNALARAGWTVLRYNWWEVTFESERVAAEIRDTYRRLAA